VKRTDDWPAGWVPVVEAEREASSADVLVAVESLLAEAMQLPEWSQTPARVRHKVEHACVEIMRSRGEVGP
jgi:acyl-CoA reductase-like NAD-dependent aldehyde dehydrogenase